MMRTTLTAAILAVSLVGATAGERDILTAEGGIVCFSPYRLSEGIAAAKKGDTAWMQEIGCLITKGGISALLITPPHMPLDEWWQVRVMPEGGPAATVWGYAQAFTNKAGKPFPPPAWARGQKSPL